MVGGGGFAVPPACRLLSLAYTCPLSMLIEVSFYGFEVATRFFCIDIGKLPNSIYVCLFHVNAQVAAWSKNSRAV